MAKVDLIMPKMGESIMEATILKWVKKPGDQVDLDETILEIATDKVDSEIPSPVAGTILETFFNEDDVVEIGKVIAIIGTEGETVGSSQSDEPKPNSASSTQTETKPNEDTQPSKETITEVSKPLANEVEQSVISSGDRFYSPLVKNMAKQEGISQAELDAIPGTGSNGRVTKKDMISYISNRSTTPVQQPAQPTAKQESPSTSTTKVVEVNKETPTPELSGNVEIIEMDRMRKLIADHMVKSKHTSPHVTSFVEADVTGIVNWRNKNKAAFQKAHGEKITFTPIFIEAVVKALRDYPMVNVSVEGNSIIVKKDINVGMAAALPSGNLIVPVIKNADYLNLAGLAKKVNDLAGRARNNKLKPEEIQDGTFTLTNVGTFGNLMGTPIINQPQVAILATGSIKKKPAVLETEMGDVIAIRHLMYLSLSYDHRVVDGALGGSFLRKVADYLESFDINRDI